MDQLLKKELEESLFIHRPLPLHPEKGLEAELAKKRVLKTRVLSGEACAAVPQANGLASLEEKQGVLQMTAPLRTDHWPEGAPADGDYCNFGTAKLTFSFDREDWREYHRLRFQVKPHILGARILHVHASVENRGEIPIPDPYYREGSTVFDLKNSEWNDCIWEFSAMPRDAVCTLSFYVLCSGHDVSAGETLTYEFREIRLEQIEHPEHELGWENPIPGIRLSTAGYWPKGEKRAVAAGAAGEFSVIEEATGRVVFTGKVIREKNERGSFDVLDFTELTAPGRYRLCSGELESPFFSISEELCTEALWKALNFFYCQRCGFPVDGRHGACHQDILARHNGVALSFSGGWHDAGDQSQQAAQTGEIVQALLEAANRCKNDRSLYLRLMEEAVWGLDFILRTRFGDGYRATSAGLTRYTDGLMGNFDDVEARVHDHSYENFLFSGVEAYAARCLRGYDDGLAKCALKAAEEDFAFAEKKFSLTGVEPAHMYEHTYNSGLSQYYAVITWAASCLYEATGEEGYGAAARKYAGRLLTCQETGEAGLPFSGFFYRDESHKTIVHFNHQAREHQFIQALEALCRTQPEASEREAWEKGMRRYGEYLKAVSGNTAPYGMLPAGVHHISEIEDEVLFPFLHVTCEYHRERENYREQLSAGKDLGGGYVLRNFPVWFSFRGNGAVLLSMGKAAGILGRYFEDEALLQLAREQLYWMWGKNPFGQSLVYGMGSSYCRQYAVLTGESVGEVPVGVETLNNGDEPYWPQNNNATYREVWVSSVCRYVQVCAELIEESGV